MHAKVLAGIPRLFRMNVASMNFALRTNFDLTFHSPKKFKLVATGNKIGRYELEK